MQVSKENIPAKEISAKTMRGSMFGVFQEVQAGGQGTCSGMIRVRVPGNWDKQAMVRSCGTLRAMARIWDFVFGKSLEHFEP